MILTMFSLRIQFDVGFLAPKYNDTSQGPFCNPIPHLSTEIIFTRIDRGNVYTYVSINMSGLRLSDVHPFSGESLQIKYRL